MADDEASVFEASVFEAISSLGPLSEAELSIPALGTAESSPDEFKIEEIDGLPWLPPLEPVPVARASDFSSKPTQECDGEHVRHHEQEHSREQHSRYQQTGFCSGNSGDIESSQAIDGPVARSAPRAVPEQIGTPGFRRGFLLSGSEPIPVGSVPDQKIERGEARGSVRREGEVEEWKDWISLSTETRPELHFSEGQDWLSEHGTQEASGVTNTSSFNGVIDSTASQSKGDYNEVQGAKSVCWLVGMEGEGFWSNPLPVEGSAWEGGFRWGDSHVATGNSRREQCDTEGADAIEGDTWTFDDAEGVGYNDEVVGSWVAFPSGAASAAFEPAEPAEPAAFASDSAASTAGSAARQPAGRNSTAVGAFGSAAPASGAAAAGGAACWSAEEVKHLLAALEQQSQRVLLAQQRQKRSRERAQLGVQQGVGEYGDEADEQVVQGDRVGRWMGMGEEGDDVGGTDVVDELAKGHAELAREVDEVADAEERLKQMELKGMEGSEGLQGLTLEEGFVLKAHEVSELGTSTSAVTSSTCSSTITSSSSNSSKSTHCDFSFDGACSFATGSGARERPQPAHGESAHTSPLATARDPAQPLPAPPEAAFPALCTAAPKGVVHGDMQDKGGGAVAAKRVQQGSVHWGKALLGSRAGAKGRLRGGGFKRGFLLGGGRSTGKEKGSVVEGTKQEGDSGCAKPVHGGSPGSIHSNVGDGAAGVDAPPSHAPQASHATPAASPADEAQAAFTHVHPLCMAVVDARGDYQQLPRVIKRLEEAIGSKDVPVGGVQVCLEFLLFPLLLVLSPPIPTSTIPPSAPASLATAAEAEARVGTRGSQEVRVEALRAVRLLVDAAHTPDALAFFLPGILSGLSRAALAPFSPLSNEPLTRGAAADPSAVAEALRGLSQALVLVMGDAYSEDGRDEDEGEENGQGSESGVTEEERALSMLQQMVGRMEGRRGEGRKWGEGEEDWLGEQGVGSAGELQGEKASGAAGTGEGAVILREVSVRRRETGAKVHVLLQKVLPKVRRDGIQCCGSALMYELSPRLACLRQLPG
ncbi:unnamed protein product [Closterium sp. Yama58-4]|nr:unnamed protein product [Closterium sp. Yama58-4]